MQKRCLSFLLLCSFFTVFTSDYNIMTLDESVMKKAFVQERFDLKVRVAKKYAVMAAIAGSVYGLIQLNAVFFPEEPGGSVATAASKIISENNKDSDGTLSAAVNFVTTPFMIVGKWVAAVTPMTVGGIVLNTGTGYLNQTWSHFSKINTVHGFVNRNTKIWKLFDALKSHAVSFDIHSQRLSVDKNFGNHKVVIEQFVKDATDVIAQDADAMKFYLSKMLVKDYTRRCNELDGLQGYALQAVVQQQRVDAGLRAQIIESNDADRHILCDFANSLMKEIAQTAAFYHLKTSKSSFKDILHREYGAFITQSNEFAVKLQKKLQLSMKDLHKQSGQGDGIFDLIYDYELLLKQKIKDLDLYLDLAV